MIAQKIKFFSDFENNENISYFEELYKRTNVEDYVDFKKKWRHNTVCDYVALKKEKFISDLLKKDLRLGEARFDCFLPGAETKPIINDNNYVKVLCNIISSKPWDHVFYSRKDKEIVRERLQIGEAFIYNNNDYYYVRDAYPGRAYLELSIDYYTPTQYNLHNYIFTGMSLNPLLNKIYDKLKKNI
mgnify:FL=1|jgi:hypothetical protein|tara:strand:- start:2772 stop:3329 length:558 start_codon:yes stop_codon:yes gene_type:complete